MFDGLLRGSLVVLRTHARLQQMRPPRSTAYRDGPEEACKVVVLNRWSVFCPSFFDAKAGKAGVPYSFTNLEGM
jgi:hypothetical protein